MNFEWQTEEERSWEETVEADPEPQRPSRGSWLWITLLLVVASGSLYFGWRTVQDRVEQATELVEEDVRSSHALAQKAANQRDEELFVTLLSGRTASWTEAQKERLRRGLLYAHAARLLSLEPAQATGNSEVTLNSELTEAVLTTAEPFVLDAGDGITQTVVMTQTSVYRKGNHRWLLSPPTPDFWGEQQTLTGEMLTVAYPEKDGAIVRRLSEDIDGVLQEMCLTFITCPPRLTVRLQLDTDPEAVLTASDARIYLRGGNELTLPSPTLIGLPVDEDAYQALFRGYASYVAALVLVETADYDCCDRARFQQAIVNLQLAELGLRPQPVDTTDYIELVDNPPDLQQLRFWWNMEEPAALNEALEADLPGEEFPYSEVELYSFIRFLQNAGEAAPVSLRNMQLALSHESRYWSWIGAVAGSDGTVEERIEREWLSYTRQQVRQAQEAISMPEALSPPEQDILALCSGQSGFDLQRLNLETEQWEREFALGVQFGILAALPDDDRYLITVQHPQSQDSEEVFRSWIAEPGDEPVQVAGSGVDNWLLLPWLVSDLEGERFFAWRIDAEGAELPGATLVDPDTCSEAGCDYESVQGLPRWSPDQKSVIYVGLNEPVLYLQRPGEGSLVELGEGQQPFWLDEQTFAYQKWVSDQNAQTLVVGTLENPEAQELMSTEMLGGLVQEADSNRLGMSLRWMDRDPYDENRILFIASAPVERGSSHLFELTRADASVPWTESEVEVRWLESFPGQLQDGWFYQVSHTSDGRWLTLHLAPPSQSPDSPFGGWLLYDLREERLLLTSFVATNDSFLGTPADLSANKEWFVRAIPGAIELVAPAHLVDEKPFRYFLPHDFEQCHSATWINGP